MFVLTELGNVLKQAREAKGLSLDDLQNLTKIQKRYLVGIENGNYDMMPGKFYVRAFIKQYAEAVGLESEMIFEQYKSDIPSVREEQLPEQQLSRVQTKKTVSNSHSKLLDLLPKVLIGVFILAIIVFFYFMIIKGSSSSQSNDLKGSESGNVISIEAPGSKKDEEAEKEAADEDANESDQDAEEDQVKEEEEVKQVITPGEPSGDRTTYTVTNADTFSVKVVSTGETWLQANSGSGKRLYSALLKNAEQTFDLTGEEKVVLIVGRTSDTQIYVNDELLEYVISPSEKVKQVITITYTKSE